MTLDEIDDRVREAKGGPVVGKSSVANGPAGC
jgi:hypothetical protein